MLRAYRKYRQRVGSRFTESYQNDVLVANSAITAKLVRYFELRFDPKLATDEAAEAALRDEILADLDDVASLDHDRILRNQLLVIDATLRTNAYVPDRAALAFKLRSADVPAMPQPAPLFEIYVYSAEVEGIHLRGGKIARGGLRWSDRMDYRTEVYGLMRAQLTKNAVIVPAGAKGGFYLQEAAGATATRCAPRSSASTSPTSARCSTSPTTSSTARSCTPHDVRVRDDDDTYLVVAADKGTATFSDTANRVSQELGFWLDDAFASGGSAGYDHKALGITARGAWESVKRHFRELGVDTQTDEFTVVGIGDMSGDVFGNGMLLSEHDPARRGLRPPARVHRPRRRTRRRASPSARGCSSCAGSSLGRLRPRELISEGGGVFPRTPKSIRLSDAGARGARRRRRAAAADRGHPRDPARAGRPAVERRHRHRGQGVRRDRRRRGRTARRDAIRVNADELRARVVGEGGNLGFTRRARVEYAAARRRTSTPTSSTTRPASTAPTTRST